MHRSFLVLAAFLYTFSTTLPAAETVPIFSTNATWKWFKGRTEASSPDLGAWRTIGFNDSAFTNAQAPFSYGEGYAYGTVITDMLNQYSCFFLRQTFVLTDAASVAAFRLGAKVDDGFIIWINGVEIERVNMAGLPGDPVTISTLSTGAPLEPVPFEFYTRSAPPGLVTGTNVVAVQVFNTTLGSSDLVFDCSLEAILVDTAPPTIAAVTPAPGPVTNLTEVTVQFSEAVTGVTAQDLSINGVSATSVTGNDATYTFGFAQPNYGNVFFTWVTNHGIADLAFPPNDFDAAQPAATWQYQFSDVVPPMVSDLRPAPSTTVRHLSEVRVTFSEGVVGVNAADLRLNGIPATNLIAQPGSVFVFQFAPAGPGNAQLSWAPGHGITDLAPSPNALITQTWNNFVDPNFSVADVIINEIMAANNSGLNDPTATGDTDPLPWIELYNRGTNTIDLAGWSLSDDQDFPQRWFFPAKTIGPGQYLVVFASGLDIRNPTGTNRLHTNFRLSRAGEFLGLYSPDSPPALISGFLPYPEQRNDISYGPDAAGNLRYFSTPTPGGPNGASSISGVAEPVHFSVQRGHFTQPFDLVLTSPTRGAVIRYTRDGTEPTLNNGFLYFGPLRMTNTTLLRAAAFRTNYLPSLTRTHSFLFNLSAAQRSLPVLSIVTAVSNLTGRSGIIGMGGGSRAGDNLFITNNPLTDFHNPSMHGIAWERPVSLELINPADNSGFQIDCGLRVQGSDYQRPRLLPTSKFSFRTYFRGDYGEGRLNYPFFPLASSTSFDQLVLRAGFNDQGPPEPFIRDETIRRLSHDMGQVASHGTVMLLFTNGGYAGYYNPTERVHEEFMQSYLGGGSEWDVISPSFATSAEGPGVVDGDRIEFNSFLNYVWNAQNNTTITNPAIYTEVGRRLDLVNFADYCLLNAYVAMGDWPANNWRAARERSPNGIWRFIVWDAEWGMGIYSLAVTRDSFAFSGTGTEDAGLNSTGNSEIARLYQRLRNNPEFRLLWADRIQKHFFNGGALTGGNISNRFNALRSQLSAVIPTMQTEILDWARDRHNIIMGQFNTYGLYGFSNALYGIFASSNAPAFNQHGGTVPPNFALTMAAPFDGSVIYYTTNGSDPRVPFSGAVSNAAAQYTGPVSLGQSTLVKARALWNGTNWSALSEAQFNVATLGIPLRLTEIMYNPTNPAHEFLEIQNVGTTPVNLSGMTFEGITFTFLENSILAAGARLLLVSDFDPSQFAARYPGATVFGYFDGNLNNGGERIALKDTAGNIIFSVDFDDAGGWPLAADGGGASLEIINPNGDSDDPANWRAGANGGSPGSANSAPPAGSVVLNEVLAENLGAVNHSGTFPDFVELANTSGAPVNLAGWSLTDDGNARQFVFPAGTTIPAGGYLVIWCDAITNTTPGLHSGFALGRGGDTVFLYDANTNLVDAITFGSQVANYSIGRVNGSWILTTPTANAANVAAVVGNASSLSINEFLANPPAGESDWIELFNNSALPVPLQGAYLATTSVVHRIASRTFVPPFGFVQLFADEGVGSDHLDFRLPAAGGTIILYDASASEVDRLAYPAQVEGLTRGRLPDGSANVVNFPGTASPGASNYIATYTGPVLNEILARNVTAITNGGRVADYVELHNPGAAAFSLAGMSLSVNSLQPGEWIFPPEATIAAGGFVVIWCDGGAPVSTNSSGYNTGESLDGESGGAYLFNTAGQLVNAIEYGFQVADRSIGLVGGAVRLLDLPTPGAANSAATALGLGTALRLNEWMARSGDGSDWFEIFNSTNRPVDMSGLVLTDDPTSAGTNQFRVAPLSFVGANSFVKWLADSQPDQGRNHVNFDLDAEGESLRLYASNSSTIIDTVAFGIQALNVSQGRLPDGAPDITLFPGSPTPAESNYRLVADVVINEVLSHYPPAGDAIELRNTGGQPAPIGGWFLSDDVRMLQKYRIADGTTIAAGGYAVFNAAQFNTGPNAFDLNRARGGDVWLSAVDGAGNLTGSRARARFGATEEGVSFGYYEGVHGIDYIALAARTLGAANAAALVKPVIISEVMYNPPAGIPGATEFIELRNIAGEATALPTDLFDPAQPGNTWRIRGAVDFTFPPATTLAAGAHVLIVDFDPTANPIALASFRALYGVPVTVPIFGPFNGRLDNAGETIELVKPAPPEGAFVPYVIADKLAYRDSAPWPTLGVDGGGNSLQRRVAGFYGNDPANWLAAPPTAGAPNAASPVPPPTIVQSPADTNALINTDLLLQANATGSGPLSWQWRFNGVNLPGATNSSLLLDYLRLSDSGFYDVYVSNAGGPALSEAARVSVVEPALIVTAPPSVVSLRATSNVTFSVVVQGTPPLHYQWAFEGADIPGANSPSFSLNNLGLLQMGNYSLKVTNVYGASVSNVTLIVLITPVVTNQPTPVTVAQGGTARFSVVAGPDHPLLPLNYRWLRNGVTWQSNASPTLVITNCQSNGTFRVVITNAAGSVNSSSVALTVLPDSDADGLPDSWETLYFGTATAGIASADLDGDGMNNREEFLAGTNPTNALSVLKIVVDATDSGILEFIAQSNLSYTVQYVTNLESAFWSSLTNIAPAVQVRTIRVNAPTPPPEPRRFYRVVTPPEP